jgi:signal peptidase II
MNRERISRLGLLLAVLISCIGCDRVTKSIATRTLAPLPRQSFLGDTIRLEFALNPGAFLGMGGQLEPATRFWLLVGANAVVMVILAYVLLVKWNMARLPFAAGALILAGGIGNLIDRVSQNGLVTDFLNVGIGPLRTGIFNVADMAITGGCVLFLWVSWRKDEPGAPTAPPSPP